MWKRDNQVSWEECSNFRTHNSTWACFLPKRNVWWKTLHKYLCFLLRKAHLSLWCRKLQFSWKSKNKLLCGSSTKFDVDFIIRTSYNNMSHTSKNSKQENPCDKTQIWYFMTNRLHPMNVRLVQQQKTWQTPKVNWCLSEWRLQCCSQTGRIKRCSW